MNQDDSFLKLDSQQLRKLQCEILPMLIEVDRLCKKHNIKYFLSDGTLLGAVRHGGFIPWDDDIDVHMLRKDYNKFCKVCKTELDKSQFFFQTHQTDKDYNWVYGKLRLNNTVYIRAGQEHLKQNSGMFIDIFPIDNISDNSIMQATSFLICKLCRKILWAPVGCVVKEKPTFKMLYKLLSFIPKRITFSVFNFWANYSNDKETKFVTSYNLEYRKKRYLLYKSWYQDGHKMDFEGQSFLVPVGYHKILKATYGDYMKLPPEDERHGRCYASYIQFLDGTKLCIDKRS